MKKALFYLLTLFLLTQGCVKDNNTLNHEFNPNSLILPSHIQDFGKRVAEEIKQSVYLLNKSGVDYSFTTEIKDLKQQFSQDWLKLYPDSKAFGTNPIIGNTKAFMEGYKNLTEIQIKFIDYLSEECAKSISYDDFVNNLNYILNDIYHEVPEIEQERLLYIISILYYSVSEIQNLEKGGQMFPTPYSELNIQRLKTRSESGSFGENCRKIYQTICTYVVGAVISTGEYVAAITTELLAGVSLFAVILCSDTRPHLTRQECLEKYIDCIEYDNTRNPPNSGSTWGRTACQDYSVLIKKNLDV